MFKQNKLAITLTMLFALNSNFAQAADDKFVVYEDITGVTLEMADDASSWLKIRSVGEAALRFGDRQDVILSTKKATLSAKAEIVKFLNERVSTQDSISDITKVLAEKNGSDAESATRKSVETMSTEIHNSADQILKGVLTLEQKVDTKNGVVKVTVGISRKSMGAADSIKAHIKSDMSNATSANNSSASESVQVGDEIKRSKNYNNF
ncbi:hypothetical protein [Methylotenera sp.]|uniref:hypothetical protein n=1 Tax=Methylotenera sp. TaxID=2051956 RepID=UPI00271ED655|nr:hypothetical protein [Methylotenera sp.]MDP2159421.1 hypothetical protein [Flavobacterium sp.]MDO9204651.1 hypothetical protein [Methylotenera sp.]MDP1522891.1 hypothetical protein [Methylotenera sp.]MDP2071508.1 hypothetical protein [Methylotenera sp.]MDP3004969.1 hypothetical protein [Methylotenera sp.]